MSVARRREWINPAHHCLSIAAQCRLLSISRSSYYYAPVPETEETLALMRGIDAAFLEPNPLAVAERLAEIAEAHVPRSGARIERIAGWTRSATRSRACSAISKAGRAARSPGQR